MWDQDIVPGAVDGDQKMIIDNLDQANALPTTNGLKALLLCSSLRVQGAWASGLEICHHHHHHHHDHFWRFFRVSGGFSYRLLYCEFSMIPWQELWLWESVSSVDRRDARCWSEAISTPNLGLRAYRLEGTPNPCS